MLVPEHDRAVELRINWNMRIRRPFDLVTFKMAEPRTFSATGFAKCALSQFKQFGSLLDAETRLRIGNLLGELQTLNAPSPIRLQTSD